MSFWKADAIAQSLEGAIRAGRNLRNAQDNLAQTKTLVTSIEERESAIAANLAEKCALRVALAKLSPTHPLLVDLGLQERIQDAGRRALAETNEFDAARTAGENFKYD